MATEQSTFDKMRSRPRFKMYSTLSQEEYERRLNHFYNDKKEDFHCNINRETAIVSVKTEHNDYWKPYLTLRSEKEDEKTVVRGIFGPSSAVWTFFMFLYFIWGILWMVFITLWFVGRQIGSSDYGWALPVSFVTLGLVALTYFAARYGQKKGRNEMELLRKFAIDSTLKYETKEA